MILACVCTCNLFAGINAMCIFAVHGYFETLGFSRFNFKYDLVTLCLCSGQVQASKKPRSG